MLQLSPTKRIRTYNQAATLQRIAFDQAFSLAETPTNDLQEQIAKANALRSLGALWDTARDAVRVLKGKPLPGSLRPTHASTRKRKRNQQPHAEPSGPAPTPAPIPEPEQPSDPASPS